MAKRPRDDTDLNATIGDIHPPPLKKATADSEASGTSRNQWKYEANQFTTGAHPTPASIAAQYSFPPPTMLASASGPYQSPPAPSIDWNAMLTPLDEPTLRCILSRTIASSESLQGWVFHHYSKHCQETEQMILRRVNGLQTKELETQELRRAVDFSQFASKAWYAVSREFSGLGPISDHEEALEAFSEVENCVTLIKNQTYRESSFALKQIALQTLLKIGQSVLGSKTFLGDEVRVMWRRTTCLEDAMKKILESMEADEIEQVAQDEDKDGQYIEKLEELLCDALDRDVLEDLGKVIDIMRSVSLPYGWSYGHAEDDDDDDDGAEEGE